MSKKKISVIIFSALLSVSVFAGCGNQENVTNNSSSISQNQKSSLLQTAGVYTHRYSVEGQDAIDILRFYEDGTVISGSSLLPKKDASVSADFFSKDNPTAEVATGKYSIVNNQLIFATEGREGSLDFQGSIKENQLILDIHSNINGVDSTDTYEYEPFNSSKPTS